MRTAVTRAFLAATALCLTALAVPAEAADPTVAVSVQPTHALPGATVHATVTVTSCTPTAVHVTFTGISASGDETGMTGATAEGAQTSPGVWETDLRIPADAAAGHSTATVVNAVADCPQPSPPPGGYRGKTPFDVDGFDTQRLTVSPTPVVVGGRLSFLQTGGRGSCWIALFKDAGGTTWRLWVYANDPGPSAPVTFDRSSSPPGRLSGSFVVPRDAHPGRSTITVHCSQSVSHPATFTTVAATSPSPAPTRTTSPPAVVAPTTPAPTAVSPSASASVSPAPSPRTIATAHKTAYGRSVGWGVLLGLLGVAAYAVTRRVRLRRLSR